MPAPLRHPVPVRRNGFWYLIRRVPKRYADIDPRKEIRLSTNIAIPDDPKGLRARGVVLQLNAEVEKFWADTALWTSRSGKDAFVAAIARARGLGITYRPAAELATRPLAEIVDQVKLLGDPTQQSAEMVATVLGGVPKPEICISDLPDEVAKIDKTVFARKSERQRKKWRIARQTAATSFVTALGADRPIAELTRQDVMMFRNAMQARVMNAEISIETANTFIGRVAAMVKTVSEAHMLELPPVFANIKLKGAEPNQRRPYDIGFVQSHLLVTGALDDLNAEARAIVYLMAETGVRLSEACNLTSGTIDLAAPVPHIRIRSEGRQLKTTQSQRDIPLVGVALMAMRKFPKGFPRYQDKADSVSAIINKVLGRKRLRPNGESVYSLRHTFKDRLRAAGATDEMKDALMGHKREEPAYGFGYSLESKAELLNRIAFKPPTRV